MLDHLGINVSDYARSRDFYVKALAPLGIEVLMEPIGNNMEACCHRPE